MSKLPPEASASELPSSQVKQHNVNEASQTFHRHGCSKQGQSDHQVEVHHTSNGTDAASDEEDDEEANEPLKPIIRRQQPEKQIRKFNF